MLRYTLCSINVDTLFKAFVAIRLHIIGGYRPSLEGPKSQLTSSNSDEFSPKTTIF